MVDTKNYRGPVKKNDVLQIANYLSSHGAGLFGIIVCRNAADRSADVTRREQWIVHRKLVIVINDDDLKQMVSFASDGEDPAIDYPAKDRRLPAEVLEIRMQPSVHAALTCT